MALLGKFSTMAVSPLVGDQNLMAGCRIGERNPQRCVRETSLGVTGVVGFGQVENPCLFWTNLGSIGVCRSNRLGIPGYCLSAMKPKPMKQVTKSFDGDRVI